jgi:hypothetical protein
MTVANAFKAFIKALTGEEPTGNTVAEVMENGAKLFADTCSAIPDIETDILTLNGAAIHYDNPVARKSFQIGSSTEGSTKVFTITVTDAGTVVATELVQE